MADETIRPPDQISAGGAAPAPDQGGIIDALRSRGPMPQQALAQMAPPPGLNAGSAFGSGVLSAIGGQPGANPYLAQQGQQQKDTFYQALNVQREQRAQQAQKDQRADRLFSQNQASMKMMKDVLEDLPEGPARDQIAKVYAQKFSDFSGDAMGGGAGSGGGPPMGQGPFPGRVKVGPLAAALATKKVTPEQIDGIINDAGDKVDPKLIALHRGVPEDKVREIIAMDPKAVERAGASSAEARRTKFVEGQIKEAQLAEKQHPELAKDPILAKSVLAIHRQMFGGAPYAEGDDKSQAAAYRQAVLQQRRDELAQFRQEAEIKATFGAKAAANAKPIGEMPMIFVDKAGNPADPLLTKAEAVQRGYFAITPKEYEGMNAAQQAMVILQNLRHTEEEMKKEHLFVEHSGVRSLSDQLSIGARRHFGDPETSKRLLGTWDSQKAQMVILLRQLGDKGVRALGAMAPAMEALNTNMGSGSVEDVLGQIESEARSQANKSRMPDAFNEVPTVFKRPGGVPGAPVVSPLTPTDLTYDPKTKTWGTVGNAAR
jgi:hypothetical protein